MRAGLVQRATRLFDQHQALADIAAEQGPATRRLASLLAYCEVRGELNELLPELHPAEREALVAHMSDALAAEAQAR